MKRGIADTKQSTGDGSPPSADQRVKLTILDACNDPKLFQPWFKGKKRKSFENWFTFFSVLFALPLTPEQLAIFTECTGRAFPRVETRDETGQPVRVTYLFRPGLKTVDLARKSPCRRPSAPRP
jgi:hypothetical protein